MRCVENEFTQQSGVLGKPKHKTKDKTDTGFKLKISTIFEDFDHFSSELAAVPSDSLMNVPRTKDTLTACN